MSKDVYRVTWLKGERRLQYRCMVKLSYDGGRTWWPPGPSEVHVAGDCYVLMMNGRYERKQAPGTPQR